MTWRNILRHYVNNRADGEGNVKEIWGWRIEVRTYVVVSCVVPMGNVSWMLFQECWSSNLRLRRGDGQAAHIRSNPHVKCTRVYCA